jgi:hypothetical protein
VTATLASPAGYVRKDEFTSAVNDQLSDAFPLEELDKGPLDAAFDIYIDDLLDCLHECATEDAVALGEALIAALALDDVAAVSFSRRPATAY